MGIPLLKAANRRVTARVVCPRSGDPPPATVSAFLMETQATYATGVLAALVEDPQTSQASDETAAAHVELYGTLKPVHACT